MIRHLSIRNYALIDHIDIHLQPGLTAFTGETGSGKSIILGAINLLLGQRAETSILRDPERKCIVEGIFQVGGSEVKRLFKDNDLDFEEETTIRREISAKGKSRAFINDTPVNLQVLQKIASTAVDIHSQHQNQTLNSPDFKFAILDAVGSVTELAQEYKEDYKGFKKLKEEYNLLKEANDRAQLDQDYFAFQLNELENSELEGLNAAEIEEELKTLTNSEEIKTVLNESAYLLNESEQSILSKIELISQQIARLSGYNRSLGDLSERLNATIIELKDISSESASLAQDLESNPNRLNELNSLQDSINHLLHKHRKNELGDLLQLRDELRSKLQDLSGLEEKLENLRGQIEGQEKQLMKKAKLLNLARVKSSMSIQKEIGSLLSELQLPYAKVKFDFNELPEPGPYGMDEVVILFQANPGSKLQSVQKTASGGELSRLMLSFKAIISKVLDLPSLIFDEIDSGVSGESAIRMGRLMKEMSKNSQIFSITHLPQVAALANHHYKVIKETSNVMTTTSIKLLNQDERVMEIATLLSGDSTPEAAIANAKVLLNQN